ncbi:MAG: DUF481 domain-containing protein [Gemmatimonadales bacterium]|nr:MAG: DUF481 domain-containing protein [Gemmatimonadales bacterium]
MNRPFSAVLTPVRSLLLTGLAALFLTAPTLLLTAPALDAQDSGVQWRNTAELTYLVSGGNSISSTLGVRNTLRRTGERGQLRLDFSTIRTDATRIERSAVGSANDFEVVEEEETVRTAERYNAQARYDRPLTERIFTYGSAGWERNAFAGFTSRTILSTGAGAQWSRDDAWEIKLAGGLTYTVQDDVTPDPDRDRSFAGLRSTLDYEHRLSSGTGLEVTWVVDANAQDWGDVRGDLSQAVSASLTDRLALKTTLQLLVDNQPPVQSIPLLTPDGESTGERVLTPLGRVDRVLSVALVITF